MLLVLSLNHLFPELLVLFGILRDWEIFDGSVFCFQFSRPSHLLHMAKAAFAGAALPVCERLAAPTICKQPTKRSHSAEV